MERRWLSLAIFFLFLVKNLAEAVTFDVTASAVMDYLFSDSPLKEKLSDFPGNVWKIASL